MSRGPSVQQKVRHRTNSGVAVPLGTRGSPPPQGGQTPKLVAELDRPPLLFHLADALTCFLLWTYKNSEAAICPPPSACWRSRSGLDGQLSEVATGWSATRPLRLPVLPSPPISFPASVLMSVDDLARKHETRRRNWRDTPRRESTPTIFLAFSVFQNI